MKRQLALVLCLLLLLSGCGILNEPVQTDPDGSSVSATPGSTGGTAPADTVPSEGTVPPPDDGIVDIGSDPLPYSQEEIFQQLFDRANKIELDIDMPEEELAKMQADYENYRSFGSKSPIYRKADVTITITTATGSTTYRIPEVGVRMKGNTSRTSFYSEEEGIYNYIHMKLDFQETFDDEAYYGSEAKVWSSKDLRKERKNRTFATLEKIDIRWNKCADSTYLKESYAYELYRTEGVLAPHTNLASLDWSGVHMGIYTINEPVDEIFLAKNLPEEELGGDLYKCGWTNVGASFTSLNSIGMEDEDKGEFYCYDLKTNKKTSQHESLTSLITALNSGMVTKERFAELVDVDNFLSYAAVSYFLGNPDDLRNNYNNLYIYFLKSSGKMILIPYDYDRCLGVTHEWNPTGNGVTQDNPFADTIAATDNNSTSEQQNPLYIYSVDQGGYYVAEFAQVLNNVAENELLKPETFEEWFNNAKKLYGGDVNPSKSLQNGGGRSYAFDLDSGYGGNWSFKNYITTKMQYFRGYMANVQQYIDYTRPMPVNYYIRGDFNGWSNHDEYGMKIEDGLLTFTLCFDHDFSFKVYDNLNQKWYGVECLPEDSQLEYTTDDHGNFDLKAGTYLVTFDPETQSITVTKSE